MNQNHNLSDQELDALFREADKTSGVPAFDDSFWNEMEAMLPKKKRKGILFWITTSAASVVVGLGLLFFLYPAGHKLSNGQVRASRDLSQKSDLSAQSTDKSSDDHSDVSSNVQTDPNSPDEVNNSGNSITDPIRRNDRKRPVIPVNPNPVNRPVLNDPSSNNNSVLPVEKNQKTGDAFTDLGKQPILFTTPVTLNDVSDRTSVKRIPYYVEFAIGYGQSYKRVDFENNWMSQFKFGGGLYTTIGQMQLSAGLAVRAEVPNNISKSTYSTGYNSQNVLVDVTNETTMRGLYSIEFPLFIGGTWNRSVLGASMTPGVQLAYTGFRTRYENTQVVSRDKQSGTIPDSKTMTMEIGLRYGYSITERVQLSASCNVDVIRPFQSTYYNGDNRNYPVSFFLGLRRTF